MSSTLTDNNSATALTFDPRTEERVARLAVVRALVSRRRQAWLRRGIAAVTVMLLVGLAGCLQ